MTDNANKIILDLCGGTGAWSRPYREAGYDVRVVTLPEHDVRTYEPPNGVYGILAAPPCTEFSVLNCRAEPRERDEETGLSVVVGCLRVIAMIHPAWWALENPVGHLLSHLGRPQMTFQPWEYGDPWTKRTAIWGDFVKPKKHFSNWECVPQRLPLYARPGRGKPNFAYLHKSAHALIPQLSGIPTPSTDAEFRAITPPGFAQAFFKANQ